jgi:hypothetical protein
MTYKIYYKFSFSKLKKIHLIVLLLKKAYNFQLHLLGKRQQSKI